MEPKLASYQVRYWTCANKNHRHRTRDVAVECIKKSSRQKRPVRSAEEWLLRDLTVAVRVTRGATFAEAGREMGVTGHRASQMFRKSIRRLNSPRYRTGDEFFPNDAMSARGNAEKYVTAFVAYGSAHGVQVPEGSHD